MFCPCLIWETVGGLEGVERGLNEGVPAASGSKLPLSIAVQKPRLTAVGGIAAISGFEAT